MNKSNDTYNLLALAGNSETQRIIIDSANAKYNNSMWRGFTEVLKPRVSKDFSTIVKETGIIVKTSVLGATDQKPLRSIEGGQKYFDSMYKHGHGMKIEQNDINFIKEMGLVDLDMGREVLETYRNRISNLIGGFHATWNSWVYEALSNQEIKLKPLGSSKTEVIDLRVPAKLKLKAGTAPWFTPPTGGADPAYNILSDLRRMNKVADDDANMPADRVYVCSKDLYDKIMLDNPFLTTLMLTLNIQDGASPDPASLGRRMSQAFGIPPIVAIDEKSRHEVDGIPVNSPDSFNKNKISLIPASRLFDMHNSPSDYADDQNPATVKAFAEGGLIGSLTSYGSEPLEVRTNMESWSIITFKNPTNSIVSLDTSKI